MKVFTAKHTIFLGIGWFILLVLGGCEQACLELCDELIGREREEVRSFDFLDGCQVVDLGEFPINQFSQTGLYEFASEAHNFSLPDNIVSFGLYAFSSSSESIGFETLTNPHGVNHLAASSVLNYLRLPLRPRFRARYNGIVIPTTAEISALPGEWAFQVGAFNTTDVNVMLSIKSNANVDDTILKIQPFITGNQFVVSDLTQTFTKIVEIYQKAGIHAMIETPISVSESKFFVVDPDFLDETTQELIVKGLRQRINVFFVEDLSGSFGSPLGIAGAIPSPQGVRDPLNGVLVNLNAHLIQESLHAKLLSETVIHEVGHWMGLYHTTERNGESFDPLSDTPQCDVTLYDEDGDGMMFPSECESVDAGNVMFWSGSLSIEQSTISPHQQHVMKHLPIACDN